MCILQIGEYVSRLSDEFKESHDNIPWRKIKGMRNFAAHQYEHIEFEVLWHTITEELPELKEMFTLSDTGEETVKLDDLGYYVFEKVLDERTISIKYDESMRSEIVDSASTIYMTINSYTFSNRFINSSNNSY